MKEKELVFASANKQKLEYVRSLLSSLDVTIRCEQVPFKEVEIDDIFIIAAEKALQTYERINCPVIVMDTGFYIEGFPSQANFPGAFIRRDLLEPFGIDGLLKKMEHVSNRNCCFRECLAYFDGVDLKTFAGIRNGRLIKEARGESSVEQWSSLWSIFVPENSTKTLAEMTLEERYEKKDNHIEAIEEFAKWYKEKEKVKVLRKIS